MVGSVRAVVAACVGVFVWGLAGQPSALAQTAAPLNSPTLAQVYLVLGDRAEPTLPAENTTVVEDTNADDLDSAIPEARASQAASADEHCLAIAVYYEARGEPLAGQAAVAQVILNRVASGRFASSVCGVIRQPGQFSFSHSASPPANRDWRVAKAIAHDAFAGEIDGPASGALYFHASYVAPNWGRARIVTIGRHIFYR